MEQQPNNPTTVSMAHSVPIRPMPEFNPDAELGASVATRWKNWVADFDMFLLASGVTDPKRQRALLLYQAGARVREIFKQLPDTGEDKDYDIAKAKLLAHFEPQKNRRYEVYRFRKAVQEPRETLDQFHNRLRTLAQTCEFASPDFELEEQIIIGGASSKIRKRALRDPSFNLAAMLLEGRRDEQSTFQAKDIESTSPDSATSTFDEIDALYRPTGCRNCGGSFPHKGLCPAKGKQCRKCGKLNHFQSVCRSRPITQPSGSIAQQDSTQNYHSNATRNLIRPLEHYNTGDSDDDYIYGIHSLDKSPRVNVTVGGHSFSTIVDTGATINVIDERTYKTLRAQELDLVSLHLNNISKPLPQNPNKDPKLNDILERNAKVFDGLGKLKGQTVHLNIDPNANPKAQPQRRIPYHIRNKVKDAIITLEKDDIIERVPEDEPTPWVSPIVAVPKKDGGVRICVDMRQAHEAIKRVRHPIPTVDDTQLQGLIGVKNIADDIIGYGSTRKEHDENLDKCLQRLTTRGLTLNASKCKLLNPTLEFFGQIFSADGTRPDPQRVVDLQNVATPTTVQEVRSLLGMANYSSQYIPNFATITAPLRLLTKNDTPFVWTTAHKNAFDNLKAALTSAPCMAYFDIHKETFVVVDASPVGVSAILSQKSSNVANSKVIAYASRALSPVETRYSQTEREALAIVWAVEHFHMFLFGHHFTLNVGFCDYNRTTLTSSTNLVPPTPLIIYHVILHHHACHTRIAWLKNMSTSLNDTAPRAMPLDEIATATRADKTLSTLVTCLRTNKWSTDILTSFKHIKDELTVTNNGIILRGHRIVIPQALQQRAIDIAHETHLGLTKTKALIREKIWFPNIDAMVKTTLDRCLTCQALGRPGPPAPITPTTMPDGPWQTVHVDFYGPLPTGEYLLVVVDRYSRFPEVEIVHSTRASTVIPKLDKIFAVHGIPTLLKSDNGPPFNGKEYQRYLTALGIKAIFSTPKWPQGNAEVERFMQPLGKSLKAAKLDGRPWKQELSRFLLHYRTTPHCTTGVPPSELLFNRQVQGKLPILQKRNLVNRHNEAREKEGERQQYNKRYADEKRNVRESPIKVGDYVLWKQERRNKLTPNFNETPHIVISRNNNTVTARSQTGHTITRNVSHFKPILKPKIDVQVDDDDDSETYDAERTERDRVDTSNPEPRRSTRNVRQPERYGEGIPSSVIR
ncbi:Transposon Tf2-9 poly [Paramuricea clavata]|uniref:Transposon Tf2-9 poly n=1 Tax=Paramuricea clavata TaxID=317549 RepID=A0A7D9E183_PARCT|nr:Transposon Tf2-9 poly [Paramuricea clavata]